MKGLLSMDAPQAAKSLAAMGQGRDSVLLHVQPDQVPTIAQALGHAGTVNPRTGLLGFWERGGDGPGGGGGAGDGGGGESEGGGAGGGGFGGGWNRSSTGLSADDMAAHGLSGYSFGGLGRSTQDFAPNSLGLGFVGFTPGSVASPEGLLAGTYAREPALGWSPSKATVDALSAATGLPVGLVATIAGWRPDDFQVVGSLGGMGFTGGTADAGGMAGTGASGAGAGTGTGGHGGADQMTYGAAFGGNAAPAAAQASAPASPGRQYQAYTGDPYAYGQGGEHQFFTNNSLSSFRPTAAAPAPAAGGAPAGAQALSPQQIQALLALLAPAGGGNGR